MQDFIDSEYTVKQVDDMVIELTKLKKQKEEAQDILKEISYKFEDMQNKVIEAMQSQLKTKWQIDGVAKLSISERAFPKMDKSPTEVKKFLDWMQKKGEDYLLSHVSVHSATLARLVKDEFEAAGGPIEIPGVDTSFRRKILSMRKA